MANGGLPSWVFLGISGRQLLLLDWTACVCWQSYMCAWAIGRYATYHFLASCSSMDRNLVCSHICAQFAHCWKLPEWQVR